MSTLRIPLTRSANDWLARLTRVTGSPALARLDGATLLGERAMLRALSIPGLTSAGGGCRLFPARSDTVALNLARPADRGLLPALFETDLPDTNDDVAIGNCIAQCDAASLVLRGRMLGLAIAAVHEKVPVTGGACVEAFAGNAGAQVIRRRPRVVDLSALWAGPLAGHLLWLAGAEVVKVESRSRPDAMRSGEPPFYALLNQGKASVVLDFTQAHDRRVLQTLIGEADIVIEAARPRALAQLGIDVAPLIQATPGLVWITITGHGTAGDAANWVGFGDDCGVAGGLSGALHAVTGRMGFVGDAIADPLTGIYAALIAWEAWASRRSARFVLAMNHIVAECLAQEQQTGLATLEADLAAWGAAAGRLFPAVRPRPVVPLAAPGEHTRWCLETFAPC